MQFPNENHFRTQPKLSLLRCAVATSNVGSRRILNKTARWCVFYTFKRSISKFPAHDLNFHGKWGARDQIKTSFKNDRTLTKSKFLSCRLLEWISPTCIVVNWLFCLLWYKKQGNKTENEWFCEEKKVSVFLLLSMFFCCCVVNVVVLIQITEKGRCMIRVIKVLTARNGILFPKLFWSTVRKDCSSDKKKEKKNFCKFVVAGREFEITRISYLNSESRARPDWAYEFPDWSAPETRICRTGPEGLEWIRTYIHKHSTN